METSNKENIKDKILEIFDLENRPINIRELTKILKEKYEIIKSEPLVKRYLDELVKEKRLSSED